MREIDRVAGVSSEELAALRQYIVANEGWHQTAYTDSLGIPTIGVGFNLRRHDASAKIRALGLDYERVLNREQALSDEQIEHLFVQDLNAAVAGASALVPGWASLAATRRTALTDLAFNVGVAGLAKFSRLLAAVNSEDWNAAETEIVSSLYYRQVGLRGQRNAAAIRYGDNAQA